MINLLRADLYRLFRSKALYICTFISIIFALLNVLIIKYTYSSVSMLGMYSFMISKLSAVWMIENFSSNVSLFIAIFIAIFITSEFTFQTIKNITSRGFSREKIYASKYISSCIASLIIFFLSFISVIILSTIMWGFGTIPDKFAINLLCMLALQVLYLISLTSIFTMIAFLVRNNGGAISINIIIVFLSKILIELVSLLLYRIIKKEIDITKYWLLAYEEIFSSLSFEKDVVIRGIIVCLSFLVVAFVIGVVTFKKRDIN